MRKSSQESRQPAPAGRPEVIVDFEFREGLLFISVRNIGDRPARKVRIEFDKRIPGVEGRKEISSLPLFRKLEFLAPSKTIEAFVDSTASYFRGKGPTKVKVTITYRDAENRRYVETIRHDLEIYRDLGYVSIDRFDAARRLS